MYVGLRYTFAIYQLLPNLEAVTGLRVQIMSIIAKSDYYLKIAGHYVAPEVTFSLEVRQESITKIYFKPIC